MLAYKTDPLDPDTDKGGVGDGHEPIEDGTDPLDASDDRVPGVKGKAIGETTIILPADGGQLVSVPYRNAGRADGSFRFGETTIAGELPQGGRVLFWDAERECGSGGEKTAKGWADAEANHAIRIGEGFLIKTGSEGEWQVQKPYKLP